MKNYLLLVFVLLGTWNMDIHAQEVERTIVVEHFTNSRCGICANRNPGFYNNLNNQTGVLHISFHPSSPYSNCILHQENPTENDARTNYYGVYGGTPRLVIQGNVISAGTNYGSASIFEPYQAQTTPVSIRIQQYKPAGEMTVQVIITAEADNSIGNASLFLGAAEDVVFYNAPNGEDEHYDVFRSTFNSSVNGMAVAVPATAGESVVIDATISPDSDWDLERLYTMAILQETESKAVIQAAASSPTDNSPIVSTQDLALLAAKVYPNPVKDQFTIQLPDHQEAQYVLRDATGRILRSGAFQFETQVDVQPIPAGAYWLEVTTAEAQAVKKIIK